MSKKSFSIALLFFLLLAISPGFAQISDLEIADSYVKSGECEIAIIYYEKIIKRNKSNKVYDNYKKCLLDVGNYKEAQKLVKSFIKFQPKNPNYKVDLGVVYNQMDEDDKANKAYKDAIKSLAPSQHQVISLANRFIKLNMLDLAYDTYKKGQKLMNGKYTFHYEIATLEGIRGNTEAMIDEYLDLIIDNPAYLNTVQNALARNFDFTEENEKTEYLREALMIRVQQYPDNLNYSEMLIWLLVQQKDFYASFIQAKALDMRLNENGYRILNLARLSKNNGDYKTAIRCYEYLAEKGPGSSYYIFSQTERLEVLKIQMLKSSDYSELLPLLDQEYRLALIKLGTSANTANILKDWAHLKAYYINDLDTAVVMLHSALEIPGLYNKVAAYIKLELADIYMITNNIWDASLLYLQVDKDFKNDILGQEAKFRNAKLYYYTGNFGWAKAQLDVLKASTSKLIANDAMELSLLISDNLALDTITTPLEMYARADLLYLQHKDEETILTLDSIVELYPGHSLQDEIYLKKYEIAFREKNYEEAQIYLEKIIEIFPFDILADKAIFRLAELYEYQYKDTDKASELYESILMNYPNSLYVDEARKKYREIRGDLTE